jgi:hypothetical protein
LEILKKLCLYDAQALKAREYSEYAGLIAVGPV